jgi:acetyl-CoA carboxylase biotin carboxyl carrier protein
MSSHVKQGAAPEKPTFQVREMHLEKIKSLIDLLGESPLAEIELIEADHAIRLTRRATAGSASQAHLQSPGQSAIDTALHAASNSASYPLATSEFRAQPQSRAMTTPADAAAYSTTSADTVSPGGIAQATCLARDASAVKDATDTSATSNVFAPMFGIVHLRPAPDAAPFVQVGQRVEEGATLCTIEAMKTFNAVEAEIGGTIVEVLAVTGTDVEAGNILFRIAP